MTYLQRINYRPVMDGLTQEEQATLNGIFDAYGAEMLVYGDAVPWRFIEEVEVVPAPRAAGPAGWFVKKVFLKGIERYHIGVYFGPREVVLPNITIGQVKYVLETIAYYAPNPIKYTGPEDVVRLTEI
jgi:hypothetical protein